MVLECPSIEVISGGRQTGKTIKLIEEAQKVGAIVLVRNQREVVRLSHLYPQIRFVSYHNFVCSRSIFGEKIAIDECNEFRDFVNAFTGFLLKGDEALREWVWRLGKHELVAISEWR